MELKSKVKVKVWNSGEILYIDFYREYILDKDEKFLMKIPGKADALRVIRYLCLEYQNQDNGYVSSDMIRNFLYGAEDDDDERRDKPKDKIYITKIMSRVRKIKIKGTSYDFSSFIEGHNGRFKISLAESPFVEITQLEKTKPQDDKKDAEITQLEKTKPQDDKKDADDRDVIIVNRASEIGKKIRSLIDEALNAKDKLDEKGNTGAVIILSVIAVISLACIFFNSAERVPVVIDPITTTQQNINKPITTTTQFIMFNRPDTTTESTAETIAETTVEATSEAIVTTYENAIKDNSETENSNYEPPTTLERTVATQPPVTYIQTTTQPSATQMQTTAYQSTTNFPDIEIYSVDAHRGESDVCVSVRFKNLMYKGAYSSISMNFNAIYNSDLVFKQCSISRDDSEITELTSGDGQISFNMHGEYCENDLTVNLLFDIPNDALDGDYEIRIFEDALIVTLSYQNNWLNPRQVLQSLDRTGQIHIS